MSVTTAGKHIAGTALAAAVTRVALYDSSDVELSGGDPAYARRSVTMTDVDGVASLTSSPVFDVPVGAEVAKAGYLTTDGTLLGLDNLNHSPITYVIQGTYTLTSGTISLVDLP